MFSDLRLRRLKSVQFIPEIASFMTFLTESLFLAFDKRGDLCFRLRMSRRLVWSRNGGK